MNKQVCPWWIGYLLASPIRRLLQKPERIVKPYLREGMTVLEIGPGMGYFTLPMARMVGNTGKVIAVDLQEKMIRSLDRRAKKADLDSRIDARVCTKTSLDIDDLAGNVDFALLFAVLHEMPNIRSALAAVAKSLRNGGHVLIAEPAGHVSDEEFAETIAIAESFGLEKISTPTTRRSRSLVLAKET